MNLADPELELIDPTPNVHSLFVHFDSLFFEAKLIARASVRWSKRMYSCAGVCSYEGRGGLCDIALSEPLLKLRPRKDLVETLLHEMIHAYLFITCRDNDRDGHGPNFKFHMHRINKSAGLHISIYHNFHDEVKLYLTHWWRCNGPCQKAKPYFGIVRSSSNRAPGPSYQWWNHHKRTCGGTYIKIKEPEKPTQKNRNQKISKDKNQGSITDFINKDENAKDTTIFSKQPETSNIINKPPISDAAVQSVIDTVRKIWADKQLPPAINLLKNQNVIDTVKKTWTEKQLSPVINAPKLNNSTFNNNILNESNRNKNKVKEPHVDSPPKKIMKIDDYFMKTANILKDIYGQDFKVTQSSQNKLKAVTIKSYIKTSTEVNTSQDDLVECPICNDKVNNKDINRHLDECLNKDVIEKISKDTIPVVPSTSQMTKTNLLQAVVNKPVTPSKFEIKVEDVNKSMNNMLTSSNSVFKMTDDVNRRKTDFIPKVDRNNFSTDIKIKTEPILIKDEIVEKQKCPCCGNVVDKPIEEHLDECLVFFNNNTTVPEEGASTSFVNDTIIIDDDDDEFDETQTFNATGTKSPCPCCLQMVEIAAMNDHLDVCLN